MNKLDLIKHGGARQNELIALADEINTAQEIIDGLESETKRKGGEWLCYVIEQGQRLCRVKVMVGHGNWLTWLKAHCPMSDRHAQRYMRIASNPSRVSDSENSIRGVMRALSDAEPRQDSKPATKSWPPFIECIGRFAKAIGSAEKHPVQKWPDEGREKLRGLLRPLFEELYPEKF